MNAEIQDPTLNNLLNHVSIIQKKYNNLAEYSGENYNVFDILGVRSSELSHSSILSNLLNAKGKHGQKDLFLKLFIAMIEANFTGENSEMYETQINFLSQFVTASSQSVTEKAVGRVDLDNDQGGRIDIVISDNFSNYLVIENKIYAGDQPKQLVRYKKFYGKSPIFYLTLFGNNPSEESIGGINDEKMQLGFDYLSISYQIHIIVWLEECIKAVYNKPFIRETLSQYLILINRLTNQSNNHKMSEEIANTILSSEHNFGAYISAIESRKEIRDRIFNENIFPVLNEIAEELNLELTLDENKLLDTTRAWPTFKFMNSRLKALNLKLVFSCGVKFGGMNKMVFGFAFPNRGEVFKNQFIKSQFDSTFNIVSKSNDVWFCWTELKGFENWEYLSTLKKIKYGNFKEAILTKVKAMATIIDLAEEQLRTIDQN